MSIVARHLSPILLVALALAACAPEDTVERPPGEGAEKQAAGAKKTAAAPGAPDDGAQTWEEASPDDAAAARALFDRAVRRQLAGDGLGSQEALIQLAARYPQTRHGRAASRRLGSSVGSVAVLGVMSAVAIPAVMKYVRRSKSSEAALNVRQMADRAVAFYQAERVDPAGNVLPRRFPQSTPLAPPAFACRDGESVPHVPAPGDWAAPGFAELGFALADPHYYRYQFVSQGQGEGATFTARAVGDLDCDGVLSTFERVGVVRGGQVDLGVGVYKKNELE